MGCLQGSPLRAEELRIPMGTLANQIAFAVVASLLIWTVGPWQRREVILAASLTSSWYVTGRWMLVYMVAVAAVWALSNYARQRNAQKNGGTLTPVFRPEVWILVSVLCEWALSRKDLRACYK